MDSKVIIGLLVIIAVLFGGVFIVRNNPQFLARFRPQNTTTAVTPTPTQSATAPSATVTSIPEGNVQGDTTAGTMPATGSEGTLLACTQELINADCTKFTQETVCGYETVTDSTGNQTYRELDYISACHLCKLYATGRLRTGDEMVTLMGYRQGACTE